MYRNYKYIEIYKHTVWNNLHLGELKIEIENRSKCGAIGYILC